MDEQVKLLNTENLRFWNCDWGRVMDKLTIATWKIGQIAGYIDISSSESKLIEIPRFQRGIVWGRAKIELLVDSLFQSFPIGSLLAFDAGSEN